MRTLVTRWRDDPGATYRTWFLWEERLKNFRSIRRGLSTVVEEIGAGRFGNQYRGSSLEVVVKSIAEQRQIFKGAEFNSSSDQSTAYITATGNTYSGTSGTRATGGGGTPFTGPPIRTRWTRRAR